jgi:tetratricopeptide (TPR) repeat protein
MFKTKLKINVFLLAGVLCLAPLVSYGQVVGGDLGSSSGLFKKGAKPKTAKTTPKPYGTKTTPRSYDTETPAKPPTKNPPKSRPKKKPPVAKKPAGKKPVEVVVDVKIPDNPRVKTPLPEKVSKGTPPKTYNNSYTEEQYEQALENGNYARDERNYSVAETTYRHAQELKPKDSRAAYGLGNLYSDLQRWEESEKAYRQAIALDPSAPEAYVALSFVLTQPIAGADVADRYVEAEKTIRKSLSLDKDNAVAYDQLGVALELQGMIGRETEDAYRKAIALAPDYALAYAHVGRLKGRNNLAAESRAAYQTAFQLAKDAPSMILVADTLQASKPFDAEQLLRRALQLDPKNPMALFLLSDVLTRQQKMAEAEKVLRDSIQISQNSYTPYSKLGDLFLQLRRYDEAEASFLKALQSASPTEKIKLAGPQGLMGVGDGYMKAGKFRDAVRAYSKARQIDPQNTDLAAKLSGAGKAGF